MGHQAAGLAARSNAATISHRLNRPHRVASGRSASEGSEKGGALATTGPERSEGFNSHHPSRVDFSYPVPSPIIHNESTSVIRSHPPSSITSRLHLTSPKRRECDPRASGANNGRRLGVVSTRGSPSGASSTWASRLSCVFGLCLHHAPTHTRGFIFCPVHPTFFAWWRHGGDRGGLVSIIPPEAAHSPPEGVTIAATGTHHPSPVDTPRFLSDPNHHHRSTHRLFYGATSSITSRHTGCFIRSGQHPDFYRPYSDPTRWFFIRETLPTPSPGGFLSPGRHPVKISRPTIVVFLYTEKFIFRTI